VLATMKSIGRALLAEVGTSYTLRAIGIGFTGVIDPQAGVVVMLNGKIPDIVGVAVGPIMAEAFGVPAYIENDAWVYMLGEWRYGAGRGRENLVCVTVGTGIGTSVIIQGVPLRSRGRLVGLLGGHFSIDAGGELCSCGNCGCLETLASASALVAAARVRLVRGGDSLLVTQLAGDLDQLDAQTIVHAAAQGDGLAQNVFDRWIGYLGAGLVTLIHAYDPDVVMIGGGMLHVQEIILPPLQAYVTRHAWTHPKGRVTVCAAQCGDDAGVLGGAVLAQMCGS
jgi:glucokinase